MDFRPINAQEQQTLMDALRGNAVQNLAILMNPRDTSFVGLGAGVGVLEGDGISDEEVISAIQSVPCHY